MQNKNARFRDLLRRYGYEEFRKIEIVSKYKQDEYLLYARKIDKSRDKRMSVRARRTSKIIEHSGESASTMLTQAASVVRPQQVSQPFRLGSEFGLMHSETPRINKEGLFRGSDQFYEDAFSRSSISDSDSLNKSES